MRRRYLLRFGMSTAALVVANGCGPLPFQQPQHRVARVGYLNSSQVRGTPNLDAFRQGMQDKGWIEGQNLIIDVRWVQDRPDLYPAFAAELAALDLDVVVAGQSAAVQALMRASGTLPIVMADTGDPVGSGLIASLARPGGNVTGVGTSPAGFGAKWLGLLEELVPGLSRVAVVFGTGNPAGLNELKEIGDAARQSGIDLAPVGVGSPDDLDRALNSVLVDRPEALMTAAAGPIITGRIREIIDFANSHGLPSIGGTGWTDAGGLMAYGPNNEMLYRRAAYYVDRILSGVRPADLRWSSRQHSILY